MHLHRFQLISVVAATLALPACGTVDRVYYGTMERLGYEKRDLLVDQVQDTREQQEDTKEQFASTLDRFRASYDFDGGDVEDTFDDLRDSYEASAEEAERLRGEIAEVKEIGDDLFAEWDDEIDQQTVPEYERRMEELRDATQRSYNQMVEKMDAAAEKMDPVLERFNGQVLMLKSSLNARAIASLQTEADDLVDEVEALIREMNESIAEADEFISQMGG